MLQILRGNNVKGFTAIELMIAIAIVVILLAVGIFNYNSYRNQRFCSAAESDAQNVAEAIANYFSNPHNNELPDIVENSSEYLGVFMSGENKVTVTGSIENQEIKITVYEGSKRCPTGYMRAVDNWDEEENKFILLMSGDGQFNERRKNQ